MATSTTTSFGVQLISGWTARPGCAFGVTQSTFSGRLEVSLPAHVDLAAIDRVLGALIGPLEIDEAPQGADPAYAVVSRLLAWHAALQRHQRIPVFGPHAIAPLPVTEDGKQRFDIAVPSHSGAATALAFRWVRQALNTLMESASPGDAAPAVGTGFESLMLELQKHAPSGINNFHLVNAARRADVPWRLLVQDIFVFGTGRHARHFNSTLTQRTSAIGTNLCATKSRCAKLLRLNGVPVPDHALATDENDAVRLAQALGYPVVVKPDDQEQGRGVAAGLADDAAVRSAFRAALKHSKRILVEKHHGGEDYRLTVLGDQVVKILHRVAGGVRGNGQDSIASLVAIEQRSERMRRVKRQTGRMLIEMDEEAQALLRKQGLDASHVPAHDVFIPLRSRNNISAGGIQTLVPLEHAHPDNLALAVRATRAVGLDLCGVDLLMPDIGVSWLGSGGVIIELNAQPQIGIQNAPEVYGQVLAAHVRAPGRIPVHVLLHDDGSGPSEPEVDSFAAANGCNAVASPAGAFVNRRRLTRGTEGSFAAARVLLLDRDVDAVVFVLSASEVASLGLPLDRVDSVQAYPHPPGSAWMAQALRVIEPHVAREAK